MNTLIRYDHPVQDFDQKGYYSKTAHAHMREGVKGTLADKSMFDRSLTMDGLRAGAANLAWGPPEEVAQKIIAEAEDAGAGTVLLMCNRGAMPSDQFRNQIRRIGREVLPIVQAHRIEHVRFAQGAEA